MLKRILRSLVCCCAILLLTTGLAWSRPLPSMLLGADIPTAPVADTPQTDDDRANQSNNPPQPTNPALQADPTAPYDPYDIKAMREENREIYGEVKDGKTPDRE